jgi:sialic acid synthase SpsE/D-lyxose ketol-isomerase
MKPLIILEIANNHMGDISHFKRIINTYFQLTKQYKSILDFAVKFQYRDLDTFINEKFIGSNHSGVKRFESTKLTRAEWNKIIKFCRNKFKLICTPFDEKSIEAVIRDKFDYIKIASCSSNDWPLLEHLYKKSKNKKIICSLGGLSEKEISDTISFFNNRKLNVKFLYCVGKYPSSASDLNLSFFKRLRELHSNQIMGYSTHEDPNEKITSAIAFSMGARIFEKHVGVETSKYKLNKYSTNPSQLEEWLINLKEAIIRFGDVKSRNEGLKFEQSNLLNFKRGVFLKKSIKKGSFLNVKDVIFQFPSLPNQLLANDFSKFNKFTLKNDLEKGEPIFKKNLRFLSEKGILRKIRDKIKQLSLNAKVVIPYNARIEISHHYGLKKFSQYGLSMITVYNNHYCKKILFLLKNQIHPEQFHRIKKETFFILYGKIKLETKKKNNTKFKSKIMKQGEIYTIQPYEVHRFRSIGKEGAVIEELSTEAKVSDSFYLDKKIEKNKNRKSFISFY